MERIQKKTYQRPLSEELLMAAEGGLLAGSIKRESYIKESSQPAEAGYELDNDPFNNN